MRACLLGGLLGLLSLAPTGAGAEGRDKAQDKASDAARTTKVRPGEDCQAIVRRVYGNAPGAMARFHTANPQLGGLPHVLQTGDIVSIPPLRGAPARRPSREAPPPEPPRLSFVGPEVRTQGKNEPAAEALPEQPLGRDTRIVTSKTGGAEVDLPQRGNIQVMPGATLVLDGLPQRRSAGTVALLDGAVRADVRRPKDTGPLTVKTPAAEVQLRGGARIEAEHAPPSSEGKAPARVAVAVYEGSVTVRARGQQVQVHAGSGTKVTEGKRPARPKSLLAPPGWSRNEGTIVVPALVPAAAPATAPAAAPAAAAATGGPAGQGTLQLDFERREGAEQYLVEVARDERFNDRRAGGEVVSPPFSTPLPPGTYVARVSSVDPDRLVGPPARVRRVRVIPITGPLTPLGEGRDGRGQPRPALSIESGALLRLPLTEGVEVRVDGVLVGADTDRSGYTLRLGPGPGSHLLSLTAVDGEPAEVLVQVAPPGASSGSRPYAVTPQDLPVPLSTPGFPTRALHPRTRVYGVFSLGASGPDLDVYRLDLGGEYAFYHGRFSVDLNLPLLYHDPQQDNGLRGGPALGDIAVGFRAVALSALGGRLALGPLLRLQVPSGTFARPAGEGAGGHPVVLDPAVALTGVVGPIGLLTSQGPTAALNLPGHKLRWSMSYVAEARLSRVSLAADLSAALGMTPETSSGAALGGGVRVRLASFRIGAGARGGLGEGGQALFGRYQISLGVEWVAEPAPPAGGRR
jgi:hypothetical protein